MKGVTSAIQKLILIVIVVALSVLVISYLILPVFGDIENNLNDLFGTGNTIDVVRFRNVVECAYYRCVKGCASDEVKRIDNIGINPKNAMENLGCYDFCDADQIKKNEKICGDAAIKNPIIIKNTRNVFVKREWVKNEADCIIIRDISLPIEAVADPVSGKRDSKIILINEELRNGFISNEKEENCFVPMKKIAGKTLQSFELKPGDYKIIGRVDSTITSVVIDKA